MEIKLHDLFHVQDLKMFYKLVQLDAYPNASKTYNYLNWLNKIIFTVGLS